VVGRVCNIFISRLKRPGRHRTDLGHAFLGFVAILSTCDWVREDGNDVHLYTSLRTKFKYSSFSPPSFDKDQGEAPDRES